MANDKKQKVLRSKVVKDKYPVSIEFSNVAKRMFRELVSRQQTEMNQALEEVYKDLGLWDRIQLQNKTNEIFTLQKNFQGVTITKKPGLKLEPGNEK